MTVSNARREAYLRAIALGMTKTLAADAAGVDRTTPYKWMEDPEFAERVADAEGQFLQRHFGVVTKAAAEGEWRASVWLLSINRPAECSTKRVELTGANGGPVAVDIDQARTLFRAALELTPEQRAAVRSSGEPS